MPLLPSAEGGIYLRRGDDLVPMLEKPYEREDDLQALLEGHPDC
jgi:hypothetical protein